MRAPSPPDMALRFAASPAAVSAACAASCAPTACAWLFGAPPLLGSGGAANCSFGLAKASAAFVPGAAALALAGIGVRSAGAGGALGVVIGATMAVAFFTPGGMEVVR